MTKHMLSHESVTSSFQKLWNKLFVSTQLHVSESIIPCQTTPPSVSFCY